uniref:CAP-Gly domain-containing protein n=1 Tax=Ascaris suum TaxID=6253 RepID=F1L5E7_ASCSU
MRYQLLEEIECPKDLFAFDDDLSNSRLVSDDTAAPVVEHGSSDERQRGLEEASPAKKIPLGADLGPHEGRDEFPLGNGIPSERSSFQAQLFSQSSLHTSTPIRESDTIVEQDTGRRVAVTKIGVGVLRYVGSVKGKEGIFCGVELDLPQGRHNGTYQGVVYFQCADKHGIFAPPHRVRLLIEVSKPLQRVRGEAAMRDRDACVARRRRASIPVYKKLKSTLESVATNEHLSKESKSKLPVKDGERRRTDCCFTLLNRTSTKAETIVPKANNILRYACSAHSSEMDESDHDSSTTPKVMEVAKNIH